MILARPELLVKDVFSKVVSIVLAESSRTAVGIRTGWVLWYRGE
jgi:hypothetical protein